MNSITKGLRCTQHTNHIYFFNNIFEFFALLSIKPNVISSWIKLHNITNVFPSSFFVFLFTVSLSFVHSLTRSFAHSFIRFLDAFISYIHILVRHGRKNQHSTSPEWYDWMRTIQHHWWKINNRWNNKC